MLVKAARQGKREFAYYPISEGVATQSPSLIDRVMDVKGEDRGYMALAVLEQVALVLEKKNSHGYYAESAIADELVTLAGKLVATKGAVKLELFPALVAGWRKQPPYWISYARIVTVAEYLAEEHGRHENIIFPIRSIYSDLTKNQHNASTERKLMQRLQAIFDPKGAAQNRMPEPWQAPLRGEEWEELTAHAATAKSTQMSSKWEKVARAILADTDTARYLDAMSEAIDQIQKMPVGVDTLQSDMLRGLAWIAGLTASPRAAALLGRLTIASAHKISGFGARSQKGFTGSITALEIMGSFDALAQLSNARNRVKSVTLSALLTAALTRAAQAQSLPLEALEELVVPTYGLDLPGIRTEELGTITARLEITGSTDVELRWFRGDKEFKSVPAEVKTEFAEELKELRAAAKEIEATLGAQRARIEGMMLSGRTLAYPEWRERYLDHPLLANMVRRLVWRFISPAGEQFGIAPDGILVDAEGKVIENLGPETKVRLWHPIQAGASAIEAWREFLITREIRQPFKQAYREIYLLTEAEERTGTYSNRFAAHVLKQHQFGALARARGWKYSLQGYFDSDRWNPSLTLPHFKVEYFVDAPEMGGMEDDASMTESGIALYVVTDQVRFSDPISGQALPLAEVPPIVFSECMRDVDLFVGVASAGNDPTWADQGERLGYGDYWRQVSFGDLGATAETRKLVLSRLLPRLSIAKVAKIDGKFLVVQGKRRTYKIHLGSGNILMEPNDQYLCIVPGSKKQSGQDHVYLPFEGDGVLAIILSKAMMLASDDKITDVTITRQL